MFIQFKRRIKVSFVKLSFDEDIRVRVKNKGLTDKMNQGSAGKTKKGLGGERNKGSVNKRNKSPAAKTNKGLADKMNQGPTGKTNTDGTVHTMPWRDRPRGQG